MWPQSATLKILVRNHPLFLSNQKEHMAHKEVGLQSPNYIILLITKWHTTLKGAQTMSKDIHEMPNKENASSHKLNPPTQECNRFWPTKSATCNVTALTVNFPLKSSYLTHCSLSMVPSIQKTVFMRN